MRIAKLGIGCVTAGEMQAQTAFSLITAILHIPSPLPPIQMLLVTGCYIHTNRNKMVEQALREHCSHLLFVDTDVVFGPDAIKWLIESDKDIVGGRYNKKVLPIETLVPNIDKLSPVPFVPTGFLLINMDVFKKIDPPWFGFDEETDSDDHFFCKKAIAAGYKVWCDPTIAIGHLGQAMF